MAQYNIKPAYLKNFGLDFLRLAHGLFSLIGLKRKKHFWGIVYDSATKQPLDPAVVRLIKIGTTLESQTCITDISGRYGFLVQPGKYKILAKKVNYIFPTEKISGKNDGLFSDVYKGEVFEVYGDSEVVGPNIPMDPLEFDWNQKAKLKYINTHPFWSLGYQKAMSGLFFGLLFVSTAFSVRDYLKNSFDWMSVYSWILVGGLGAWWISKLLPTPRLFGQVLQKGTRLPVEGLTVEVVNPSVPTATVGKAVTNEEGKFFIRMNKGKYLIKFSDKSATEPQSVGQLLVKVNRDGVINHSFWLRVR
jgi:hypothetical protein